MLESRPVSNVSQALQGAVAGMNFSVGNGGGELDNSLSFNIRGAGTIGSGSEASALVLIDGMEGDLSTLNPQDIENISVLKDAASSSIYGSRAAFGVVLITTKSGKEGKITLNYNNNFRFSSPLLQPHMLDSESFAYYFNEASVNAGQQAYFHKELLEKIKKYKKGEIDYATEWDEGRNDWQKYDRGGWDNVNWYKEFYRDWVPSQEHNISARGGTEKTNFFFSANWLGQDGLMKYNPDKRDRYTINTRISSQLLPYLKMVYGGKFSRVNFGRSSYETGLFYHNIARRWPTLPLKDPNGHYVWGNEIANLNNGRLETESDELVQQLELVLSPVENWNTHIQLNYKSGTSFTHGAYLPIYKYGKDGTPSMAPLQFASFWSPGASRVTEEGKKWNFFNPNIYSEYSFDLDDIHNFKIMAGFQSELNKTRRLYASRDDVYTPNMPTINTTYGEEDSVEGDFQHWATAGFFGRLNYDYNGIYLLELNGRYDGTSRFLADKRWNFFPSASVGYNISKESFFEGIAESARINTLKLRGSYGVLGNQNISNWYPFYPKMPVGAANGWWLIDGKKPNTAGTPGLVSEVLTWERVKSWNFGFDLNMLDNKLGVVFDLFNRTTYDMVGPAPQLPKALGTDAPKINNTDMESKGFELELSWRDRIGDDFKYGIKATLTDSRQIVTKYPNENGSIYWYNRWGGRNDQYYNGKEIGDIWGYTSVGIAKTDEQMNKHLENNKPDFGSNWTAGDVMYEDLNGDKKVNRGAETLEDHGDLKVIGNSTPRYNFGVNLDFQYKGIDFSAFFQGTGKRDLFLGGTYFNGANTNIWQSPGFEEHLDYFRPADTKSPFGPNLDAYYPRPLFDSGWKNFETQTRWLQNGAYVRLKNIQLGYTIPAEITEKIGISKFRVYLSGENMFTWTKLSKIFDPETTGGKWYGEAGKIYPLSRTISTGISVTF